MRWAPRTATGKRQAAPGPHLSASEYGRNPGCEAPEAALVGCARLSIRSVGYLERQIGWRSCPTLLELPPRLGSHGRVAPHGHNTNPAIARSKINSIMYQEYSSHSANGRREACAMTLLTLVAAAREPGKVPAHVEKHQMRSCIAASYHQYKSSSCTHFHKVWGLRLLTSCNSWAKMLCPNLRLCG